MLKDFVPPRDDDDSLYKYVLVLGSSVKPFHQTSPAPPSICLRYMLSSHRDALDCFLSGMTSLPTLCMKVCQRRVRGRTRHTCCTEEPSSGSTPRSVISSFPIYYILTIIFFCFHACPRSCPRLLGQVSSFYLTQPVAHVLQDLHVDDVLPQMITLSTSYIQIWERQPDTAEELQAMKQAREDAQKAEVGAAVLAVETAGPPAPTSMEM